MKKENPVLHWNLHIQSTSRLPLSDFCMPACHALLSLFSSVFNFNICAAEASTLICLQNVVELSLPSLLALPGNTSLYPRNQETCFCLSSFGLCHTDGPEPLGHGGSGQSCRVGSISCPSISLLTLRKL